MISSIEINNTDISIKLLAFTKYFLMLGDLDKQATDTLLQMINPSCQK